MAAGSSPGRRGAGRCAPAELAPDAHAAARRAPKRAGRVKGDAAPLQIGGAGVRASTSPSCGSGRSSGSGSGRSFVRAFRLPLPARFGRSVTSSPGRAHPIAAARGAQAADCRSAANSATLSLHSRVCSAASRPRADLTVPGTGSAIVDHQLAPATPMPNRSFPNSRPPCSSGVSFQSDPAPTRADAPAIPLAEGLRPARRPDSGRLALQVARAIVATRLTSPAEALARCPHVP